MLTFLAEAEVDPTLLGGKVKESLLIGGLSFALPFIGVGLFAYFIAGWDLRQAEIAGIALSTTSLAVVYAVLVETGLTKTEIGKIIMAATFVTDLGTALALTLLFIQPTPHLQLFIGVSIAAVVGMLLLQRHPEEHRRFRFVAFSLLTPFFFFKGGLNVSLGALAGSIPLLLGFFVTKIGLKFAGVFPVALRYVRPHATYTTLLMSTGLTFGTISSLYGLNAGILDRTQFSLLVTVVILSAVVPTAIAQRFFSPPVRALTEVESEDIEDEEFAR